MGLFRKRAGRSLHVRILKYDQIRTESRLYRAPSRCHLTTNLHMGVETCYASSSRKDDVTPSSFEKKNRNNKQGFLFSVMLKPPHLMVLTSFKIVT